MTELITSWGSHAPYILSAYGVAALCFIYLVLEPVLRRRKLREQLRAQWRREQLAQSQSSEMQS